MALRFPGSSLQGIHGKKKHICRQKRSSKFLCILATVSRHWVVTYHRLGELRVSCSNMNCKCHKDSSARSSPGGEGP